MSRIVEDLLMFSRLEQGTEIYPREELDLSSLVNSVCEDMALLRLKGITLDWSCQDQIYLKANRSLIIRMLTNLISNAYRYGRDQGISPKRSKKKKTPGQRSQSACCPAFCTGWNKQEYTLVEPD